MQVWAEIEYESNDPDSEHGGSVHSDICCEESELREFLPQLFEEILRNADFSKPWSLHTHGLCPDHNKENNVKENEAN